MKRFDQFGAQINQMERGDEWIFEAGERDEITGRMYLSKDLHDLSGGRTHGLVYAMVRRFQLNATRRQQYHDSFSTTVSISSGNSSGMGHRGDWRAIVGAVMTQNEVSPFYNSLASSQGRSGSFDRAPLDGLRTRKPTQIV